MKRKLQPISPITGNAKIFNKILVKPNLTVCKKNHTPEEVDLSQRCKDGLIYANLTIWYHISKMDKIMINFNRCRKSIWQTTPFMIKSLNKVYIEATYVNTWWRPLDKPIASIIINSENWKASKSGTRQECTVSLHFNNIAFCSHSNQTK